MSTTLIVRDATLAINGALERRGDPGGYLRTRIAEVQRMDERTAEECVEVLSSVAGGEAPDLEALQALLITAVAHPGLAQRLRLSTVAVGRKLAATFEREGSLDGATAVLELLLECYPEERSVERDLAQIMRRRGTVQDLVRRYFERAHKLVREGRNNEAAGWLREVLQLDPTRKDAARMLRNLRFKKAGIAKRKSSGFGSFLVFFACVAGLAWVGLREYRLHGEFAALPEPRDGSLQQLESRLGELDRFMAAHPVWHGALMALQERTELRTQVAVLQEEERQLRVAQQRAERERMEAAELSRRRGLLEVQGGDYAGALEAFREALEYGGPDWSEREQVERYVADLEALPANQR